MPMPQIRAYNCHCNSRQTASERTNVCIERYWEVLGVSFRLLTTSEPPPPTFNPPQLRTTWCAQQWRIQQNTATRFALFLCVLGGTIGTIGGKFVENIGDLCPTITFLVFLVYHVAEVNTWRVWSRYNTTHLSRQCRLQPQCAHIVSTNWPNAPKGLTGWTGGYGCRKQTSIARLSVATSERTPDARIHLTPNTFNTTV